MEYEGGTTSTPSPLRHEAFHSWWARGVKAASQPDGWFDEAWTVYNVAGATASVPFDFTDPPVTLSTRNPWIRVTASGSYTNGERFFEGVAAMTTAASLRSMMADLYQTHGGTKPMTTQQLEEGLVTASGKAGLVDAFSRFVYGYPATSPPPDLWLRDEVGDPGDDYWAGRFWDSPDLWVRRFDDDAATHQNPEFGQDNWFHARVRNRSRTARHFVVTFNALGLAGTQFQYPADFLPATTATAEFELAPGETRHVKARWPRSQVPPAGTHICIVAAVLTPGEHPAPGAQVWEDNSLAQKNLTVVDFMPGDWFVLPALVVNLGSRDRQYLLQILRSRGAASIRLGLLHRTGSIMPDAERLRPFSPPNQPAARSVNEIVANRRPLTGNAFTSTSRAALTGARFTGALEAIFPRGTVAHLPIRLPAASQVLVGLRVSVPNHAKPGSSFIVDMVQRDQRTKRIVGGVAVQINVTPKHR